VLFLSLFHGGAGSLIKQVLISNKHAETGRMNSILPVFIIPVIWIVKDLALENIFGGFPWCLAGSSQYNNIYYIQLAEIGGIHLITFSLIVLNMLFYRWWQLRDKKTPIVISAVLICIYALGFGLYHLHRQQTKYIPTHLAGIVQPNTSPDSIPLDQKQKILNDLLIQSKILVQQGAEFIVWPEHTVSIYPLQSEPYLKQLTAFSREYVPLLAGFTDLNNYKKIYNSAMLFDKQGVQKYDKIHLTPFGEYILFRELLFFVKRITDEISDFSAGTEIKNLSLQGHATTTPICYEIIFPELVRRFIAQNGELIITISNDSWFGPTSAPFQHLSMAVFRALENRRWLLRSTTNGISAVISPEGHIRHQSPYDSKDYFIASFQYLTGKTFFTRYGFLFPYLCVLLLLIYFAWRFRSRLKK